MNQLFEALRLATAQQHQRELDLLRVHHREDVAQIEALATTMGNRMSLMERLNTQPDPAMDLREQLPSIMRNLQPTGGYQQ